MKILAVGDLVGIVGLKKFEKEYKNLKEKENIDFCIVNAENVAEGMGITEKAFQSLLNQKVDCITMGNHTWAKKDIFSFIDHPKLIRPANYSANNPGKGYQIFECKDKKIAVINLIGRVTMNVLSENPFTVADKIVEEIKDNVDIIIIDFHAEATAEKIALAYHLDGKVTAIFGTHTHVQTADETILKGGTAYITDIGMTGPIESVIGMDKEASIKRFLTSLPERYKIADGEAKMSACIFEINDEDCRVKSIKRINIK
ncbi:MAG: TIGR00282 family metallophosphoesterase [Clostridia bacterium]|nr:TIGR00282 family metallophosphoesterase [Clostridia bacterium]